MTNILEKISENIKIITVITLFIISGILIAYMFPRQGKFRYEFKRNSPWMHENLQAPFDFPIYKPESFVQAEKDSVLNHFTPYFSFDAFIIEEQLDRFNEDFDSHWNEYTLSIFHIADLQEYQTSRRFREIRGLQEKIHSLIDTLLEEVYTKGIVDINTYADNTGKDLSSIVVVKGNVAEEYDIDELYTPKSAYDKISNNINNFLDEYNSNYAQRYHDIIDDFDINEYIVVNVLYDEETSNTVKRTRLNEISLYEGMVQEGQLIIAKGDLVTREKFRILESLKKEFNQTIGRIDNRMVSAGNIIIAFVSMLIIYLFFWNFRPEIIKDTLKTSFILLMIVLIVFVANITGKLGLISFYVIPFTILPIIVRAFYDERIALFIHVITMLLVSIFVPSSYEFIFLSIIAGIVAIFSLTNLYHRSRLIITAVLIILTYCILYFGMSIIQEGQFDRSELTNFAWFGINGVLILISYPLIYVFEKTFGFLSDATLMELSDTNQPLLRKLAETAPGTFQHSIQVSSLAEEAAYKTGGNALLIRAGALYHDIGKMIDPVYFIENQTTGYNPHDNLEFEESATKIINHTIRGVEMAKKNNLPQSIIDFIRTHHGTTTVQYFYKSYIKKYPETEVDIKRFSYPGPKPFSKEMAILMMADSVEAASRSLTSVNDVTINNLVDNIIDYQQKEGQFNNANITFKDITLIREIFKKRLCNIYHVRVSYPK